MKITPLDIKKQEFKKIMRGFDPIEVETFLEMVAEEFEALIKDKNNLSDEVLKLKTQLQDYQEVEKTFKEFSPLYPFEFSFIDERINRMYENEQRFGKIFNCFTSIAIFISCLGLFGLISYTAQQKVKEIGIRKVLGASIPNIVYMLSSKFLVRIVISSFVAVPIAYYGMTKWLQNFAYRTTIGFWPVVGAIGLALLIAILTISHQSIKAASANPVDSLRYE